MAELAPYWSRTPALNWLYRLLGASIGHGALLDTSRLQVSLALHGITTHIV